MELKQLFPIAALALLGCQRDQWDDCITSSGSERTEERTIAAFTTIELDDRIDLVLETRDVGSVSVEAGSNLIGQVVTEVDNGVLKVRNDMRCHWVRSFKPRVVVHVPVAGIDRVILRGTGNVSCTDTIVRAFFALEQWGAEGDCALLLNVDVVDIGLHTGAGKATLRGCCATANLYSGIMAPIDASGLDADVVNVNNSSVADFRCRVALKLNVGIHSVGDVYYTGTPPEVYTSITGSGHLYHMD